MTSKSIVAIPPGPSSARCSRRHLTFRRSHLALGAARTGVVISSSCASMHLGRSRGREVHSREACFLAPETFADDPPIRTADMSANVDDDFFFGGAFCFSEAFGPCWVGFWGGSWMKKAIKNLLKSMRALFGRRKNYFTFFRGSFSPYILGF